MPENEEIPSALNMAPPTLAGPANNPTATVELATIDETRTEISRIMSNLARGASITAEPRQLGIFARAALAVEAVSHTGDVPPGAIRTLAGLQTEIERLTQELADQKPILDAAILWFEEEGKLGKSEPLNDLYDAVTDYQKAPKAKHG